MSSESDHSPQPVPDRMIGVSAHMQRLFAQIHQASAYAYPVLLSGEKGTGKKLAARTIHSLSQHKQKAFVIADFSKMAPTLAESELFGYERGAFAGASQTQWGLLAFAREGTILLNEVGDLPLHVQVRFVQTLQQREFTPIGSTNPIPFKARVLATTSRDLKHEVKRGAFRQDLFLRLTATQICLPPLRERKEDIPLLVDYFLEKFEGANQSTQFSPAAIQHLRAHDWPGNVRELQEKIQQVISNRSGSTIEVSDLNLTTSELPTDQRWAAGLSSYLDEHARRRPRSS